MRMQGKILFLFVFDILFIMTFYINFDFKNIILKMLFLVTFFKFCARVPHSFHHIYCPRIS